VAFFETFNEFGEPLAEIWCELVVFEMILEQFDHLWCSAHGCIRLADRPVQEVTNVVVVERESAPEDGLHSLTDRPGLVEGREPLPVTKIQPRHRSKHEVALLLLACREDPTCSLGVPVLEGVPTVYLLLLLGDELIDPGPIRLCDARPAPESFILRRAGQA
jgi:hypothetical protein